jgi:hypothetical protein
MNLQNQDYILWFKLGEWVPKVIPLPPTVKNSWWAPILEGQLHVLVMVRQSSKAGGCKI